MDQPQQLRDALTLGVIIAAFAGCSDDSAYKTYTPEATPVPPAVVTSETPAAVSEEPDQLAEVLPAADPASVAAAPATQATLPDAENATEPTVDPAAAVDVAASRPEDIVPFTDAGVVTPAAASEPDDTLVAAVGTSAAVAAMAAKPLVPKVLIPENSFKREGDALRVSYDDLDLLKVLNMEPVVASAPDMFPQWLKDLEGQRIRIRGYMRPGELDKNLPFFILARDTKDCCFGANSKPYDIIPVIMREGVTTDYIHFRPFDVVGEFHIGVELDFANPDRVEFMYRIEDAVVIYKQ